MNPKYFGDSYDLVKRFFCRELVSLGYIVTIDPLLTGSWGSNEQAFYRLVCARPHTDRAPSVTRTGLFLDPDTGVKEKGSHQHVSFDRLTQEARRYDLVFSFDQSFSRQATPIAVMQEKLLAMRTRGCHAMYYDSHARFLFVSREQLTIVELRAHLESLGLPLSRLPRSE